MAKSKPTAAASVRDVNKALREYIAGLEPSDRAKTKLEIKGQDSDLAYRGPKLKIPGFLEPGFYEIVLLDPEGEIFLQTPMVVEPPEEDPEPEWTEEEDPEAFPLPVGQGAEQFAQLLTLTTEMHRREMDGMARIFERQREMDREHNQRMMDLHRESNEAVDRRVKAQMREFVRLTAKPEEAAEGSGGLDSILGLINRFLEKPEEGSEGGEE